jgi:hypothetical protein
MYIFHLPMRATYPAHLIFIALIILFGEYKVQERSYCRPITLLQYTPTVDRPWDGPCGV